MFLLLNHACSLFVGGIMDIDTLYQQHASDPRPLPLIIAELWQFPLAHVEQDNEIWYAVQDWIVGVGQTQNARQFWRNVKSRAKKIGVELSALCIQLPYKATNGKIYQMEYANAQTLLVITTHMSSTTGIASHVLNGKFSPATQLTKPQQEYVYLVTFLEINGYYKIGKTQDVYRRVANISTNVPFTIKLDHVFTSQHAASAELKLHKLFASKRIKLEWFALDAHDVELIKSISCDDDLEHLISSKM